MDTLNEKLSIKNMLFTKALPNYVIRTPINGHKTYACTDCGDKFVFESSYNDHINRKSIKVSYMCRHCGKLQTFYNRCNLLMHIRSHVFKTATINVSDLKIEPLPFNKLKINLTQSSTNQIKDHQTVPTPATKQNTTTSSVFCFECKQNVTNTSIAYKDRASHYMHISDQVFSCPICLFALPSICAFKTHLRLHLKCPPFYCPECGAHLSNKNLNYPYNHDCEGFKMMRATTRLQCSVDRCRLFHPNDHKEHMRGNHMHKVFKCPFCVVACFSESTMQKHLLKHDTETKPLSFYQCDLCPGKFVPLSHIEKHTNASLVVVYPCWPCRSGTSFKAIPLLLQHFKRYHNTNNLVKDAVNLILTEHEIYSSKPKRIYRVVKRCDQCRRSFTYKCKFDEIHILPVECPYKCTSTLQSNVLPDEITCNLCKSQIQQDWTDIKKHFAVAHEQHKCLDIKVVLTRIDISKYLSKNKKFTPKRANKPTKKICRRNKKPRKDSFSVDLVNHPPGTNAEDLGFQCKMCGENYITKILLQNHMISHRDPCMAYQCMECGKSFVVKPTFSKHLLLEHGIVDTEGYITNKKCYYENAYDLSEQVL